MPEGTEDKEALLPAMHPRPSTVLYILEVLVLTLSSAPTNPGRAQSLGVPPIPSGVAFCSPFCLVPLWLLDENAAFYQYPTLPGWLGPLWALPCSAQPGFSTCLLLLPLSFPKSSFHTVSSLRVAWPGPTPLQQGLCSTWRSRQGVHPKSALVPRLCPF